MAVLAIRRKLLSRMVRIRRRGIIRLVATRTGVRRIRVVAVVAHGTVVRNRRVCPVQHVIVVVDRERRRRPARLRTVASRTIRRQPEHRMVGIGRLVVVGQVTGVAIQGRTRVPVRVATYARSPQMRPRQRKGRRIVVEHVVRIPRRVTGQTGAVLIDKACYPAMRFAGLRIPVTSRTLKDRIVGGYLVTFRASVPYPRMCSTVNGKIGAVMIGETGRHPTGIRRVAPCTVLPETGRPMVGIHRPGRILRMTSRAIDRRGGITPACMTLRTCRQCVPCRQRKETVVHPVRLPPRRFRVVTIQALDGETRRQVVRIF